MSANEIRSIINEDAAATGNNAYKNLLGTANTDWQDQIYQSAYGYDNNLSATGSAGTIPFRISAETCIRATSHATEFSTAFVPHRLACALHV